MYPFEVGVEVSSVESGRGPRGQGGQDWVPYKIAIDLVQNPSEKQHKRTLKKIIFYTESREVPNRGGS